MGEERVEIHTDGSCSGNPGPGGWGAVIRGADGMRELSGSDPSTTNNRMELMAPAAALEALARPCRVRIVTDSRYVRDGITRWMAAWKRREWRTVSGGPVKNRDLWERLERAAARHEVEWRWVRGHAGDRWNERADALARAAGGAAGG